MDTKQLDIDISDITRSLDAKGIQEQLATAMGQVANMFCAEMDASGRNARIYQFLIEYIEAAPVFINLLQKLATRQNLSNLVEPYLLLSSRYLVSACDELKQQHQTDSLKSFLTLLQGAYIFHRLVEELDDRVQGFIGIPLTNHDMVNTNIIAHEVIGDRFANKLDKIVLSLFQQSKVTKSIVEAQLNRDEISKLAKGDRALSGELTTCFAAKHDLRMSY